MLKYLVILLDDSSVSYCHYNNRMQRNLMPLDILRKGIMFAMKNDLKIQYPLPSIDLPQDYDELMDSMIHDNIGSWELAAKSSFIVVNGFGELVDRLNAMSSSHKYLIRVDIHDFIDNIETFNYLFKNQISANIVFTDLPKFSDNDIPTYQYALEELCKTVECEILSGKTLNTNIITDRIALESMNNCGAGESCITLAPNGNFYPCPAFYYDDDKEAELGNVDEGIYEQRRRLYFFKRAPLCKRCDSFQCKRCVWLNKSLTCEANIPSRQQCIISHIERNASGRLLERFHQKGILLDREILPINYLDPFDNFKDS